MASWKKLLVRMLLDPKPCTYTYDDAARVLRRLGFECAPTGGGTSHRRWRGVASSGKVVVVGLVDAGAGVLDKAYIEAMLAQLRGHQMIPADLQGDQPNTSGKDPDALD